MRIIKLQGHSRTEEADQVETKIVMSFPLSVPNRKIYSVDLNKFNVRLILK